MAPAATVLVVEDDPGMRRLVRTGLELEGVRVIEAATIAQARSVTERVDAVVLDCDLPDGDGLDHFEELAVRHGGTRVVIHSNRVVPDRYPTAPKGDIDALLRALALETGSSPPARRAPDVARERADEIVGEWAYLCEWDPEQPPESTPPLAGSVVRAVAAALERPQPLGWGLDPALAPLAEAYALNVRDLDTAVSQLVCLRETFERLVVEPLPVDEQLEAGRRLTMLIQRLTTVIVRAGTAQLRAEAFVDPLTGLLNRRAFGADLARELARAARHGRPLTLVAIDVDGLKAINDREGHHRGDQILRALATALTSSLRSEDAAYRLGGDEFALLLPDTLVAQPDFLVERFRRAGAPACSVGLATHPPDPADRLVQLADERMYAWRHQARSA